MGKGEEKETVHYQQPNTHQSLNHYMPTTAKHTNLFLGKRS